jgi:hypothetical protein
LRSSFIAVDLFPDFFAVKLADGNESYFSGKG